MKELSPSETKHRTVPGRVAGAGPRSGPHVTTGWELRKQRPGRRDRRKSARGRRAPGRRRTAGPLAGPPNSPPVGSGNLASPGASLGSRFPRHWVLGHYVILQVGKCLSTMKWENTFWILNNSSDLKGIGTHNNPSILIRIMVTMSPSPAAAAHQALGLSVTHHWRQKMD